MLVGRSTHVERGGRTHENKHSAAVNEVIGCDAVIYVQFADVSLETWFQYCALLWNGSDIPVATWKFMAHTTGVHMQGLCCARRYRLHACCSLSWNCVGIV